MLLSSLGGQPRGLNGRGGVARGRSSGVAKSSPSRSAAAPRLRILTMGCQNPAFHSFSAGKANPRFVRFVVLARVCSARASRARHVTGARVGT